MSREIKLEFGKRFRTARDRKKLSRATLGVRLGISPKTIQSWEMGRTFIENLSLIPAIESELDISVSELIAKATTGEEMHEQAAETAADYGASRRQRPLAGPLGLQVTLNATPIGELPDPEAIASEFLAVPIIRPQAVIKPVSDLTKRDIIGHTVIAGEWVPRGGVLVAYRMADSGMTPMIPLGGLIVVDRRPIETAKAMNRVVAMHIASKGLRVRRLITDPVSGKLHGMTAVDGRRGKVDFREDLGDIILGRVVGILAHPE